MTFQSIPKVITSLTLTFVLCSPLYASQWEQIDDDNGIRVYRKSIPGSPLVAFKGVKVMAQPIAKVAQVLLDPNPESRLDWVDMITDFKFLEKGEYHAVAYSSYALPWPLADRDYVTRFDLKIDNDKNRVFVYLKSVEHADAPETVGVRAHLINSLYELEPLPDGSTKVTVEIQTDPKGSIPKWLVNLVQKGWPAKTLAGMEQQAAKPGTHPNQIILEELESLKSFSLVD